MTRSRKRKLQRTTGRQRTLRAIAAGVPTLIAGMSAAYAQQTQGGLEEIIVTATKRAEDLQSVPLSIQALSTQKLEQLNVKQFDDYVKFLPSVSYQSFGPGFAAVYMRGVASGGDGNHSGPSPSVGMYLDEQPITTIQGALDVHMYDIERVEALAGPQGTLYGASSQAGTIRIITNKPNPREFDSGYGLEVNSFAGGSEGYLGEAFVNLPINDRTAVRLVGWYRHDGGYIDNVVHERVYPTSGIVASSARFAEDDYNDADTYGARAALRFDVNDSWTITPQVMGQKQEVNGNFAYDTSLGKDKVAHIAPEVSDDRWVQAALTVEGKIANLDVMYAGAYLDRKVDTESDYSDYSYWYDTLYAYGAYWVDNAGDMVDPSQYIQGVDDYNRYSHELRIVSDPANRFRVTAGAFLQRQEHDIQQRYKIRGDIADSISITGWPDTIWLTKQLRVDKEWAVFGEFSFDFTEKLTGTVGGRYFDTDNSLKGFFGYAAGYSSSQGEASCPGGDAATAPDFETAPCKTFEKSTKEDDVTPRVNLTYKFNDDALVYATYSEGFRPGGINRRGTLPPYLADWLKNYELGWKSTWLDNRLRFNGAVFQQNWDDFQFALLGANGLTEINNAGAAEIKGVEMDLTWQLTDGLGLSAGVAYLDSELTENFCGFTDANGKPITSNPCPLGVDDNNDGIEDTAPPEAPEGTQLPVTPEWKANATLRYEFPVNGFDSFVQGSVIYSGERESDLRIAERELLGKLPSYTIADFSAGFGKDTWRLELYVNNAFDETAEMSRFVQCLESVCGDQIYVIPQRPRQVGLKFSQDF
jgi:iron complex outermembrane receptor protein